MTFRTAFIATIVTFLALVVGRLVLLPAATTGETPGETRENAEAGPVRSPEPPASGVPGTKREAEMPAAEVVPPDRDSAETVPELNAAASPGHGEAPLLDQLRQRFRERDTSVAGQWVEAFADNPRDDTWAPEAEHLIESGFNRSPYATAYTMVDVECRTDFCLIAATVDPVMQLSLRSIPEATWFGMMRGVRSSIDDQVRFDDDGVDTMIGGPPGTEITWVSFWRVAEPPPDEGDDSGTRSVLTASRGSS